MPKALSFWKLCLRSTRPRMAECRRWNICVMMMPSPPFWPSNAKKFSVPASSGWRDST